MVLVAPELWAEASKEQKEFVRISRVIIEGHIGEALEKLSDASEEECSVEAGRIYADVISGLVHRLSAPDTETTLNLSSHTGAFLRTFFGHVLNKATAPEEPNFLIALVLVSLLDMALAEPLARHREAERKKALRASRQRPEERV